MLLLLLLGGFLLISLMAFKRQDQIGNAFDGVRSHAWSDSTGAAAVEAGTDVTDADDGKTVGGADELKKGLVSKETEEVMRATEKMEKEAGNKKEKVQKKGKGKGERKGVNPLQAAKEGVEKQRPGPKMGDRELSEGSLESLRNSTLGVSSSVA